MKYYKISFLPKSAMGKKITDYYKSENEYPSYKKKAILKHCNNGDKTEVKFLVGEAREADIIEQILKQQCKVQLIFGPRIFDSYNKEKLVELKRIYDKNFEVFQIASRAKRHGILVNNDIILESPHEPENRADSIVLIEEANPKIIDYFNMNFDYKKKMSKKLDDSGIKEVKLIVNEGESDDI